MLSGATFYFGGVAVDMSDVSDDVAAQASLISAANEGLRDYATGHLEPLIGRIVCYHVVSLTKQCPYR